MCCRTLEDCLLTRTGFRVFLFTVLTLIVGAIVFNISYKFVTDGSSSEGANDRHVAHVASGHGGGHHVLLWTPLHGSWSEWWTPPYLGDRAGPRCPQLSGCSFTSDRGSLNISSVVLFSYSDLAPGDMPPKYLVGQKWALFLPRPTRRHLASGGGGQWSRYLPMFDVLISYFPQSNIPMYRARVVSYSSDTGTNGTISEGGQSQDSAQFRHAADHKKLWRNLVDRAAQSGDNIHKQFSEFSSDLTHFKYGEVRNKRHHKGHRKRRRAFQYDSRLVATIIDDCQTDSNREGYIEAMAEHVNIHIYGTCGAPCPGATHQECLQYLARFYKFVLVFEPFMCQHFVSDLIWTVLKTNLVPVVFGGVNYAKLLPLGSYIDALNQSPKNLAHFLRYLDKNEELYNNYLQWKKEFYILEDPWLCRLCSSLTSITNHFAFPPSQVALEPPEDMCTSWPDLKFSVHPRSRS